MTLRGPRTKFENPVDITQLPKERLSLNWPVRNDPSFSILGDLLFIAAIPFTPGLINLLTPRKRRNVISGATIGKLEAISSANKSKSRSDR